MKIRMAAGSALLAACGVVVFVVESGHAQQAPAGPYTAQQAAAGRTAYQTNCASCHAPDLSGREGPQLAGANFMRQWGDRTAGDLIAFIRATMPPGGSAPLAEQTYINIAAFLLDSNSARAGDQALTAQSAVVIRTIASGQRAVSAAAAAPATPKETPRGITAAGEARISCPSLTRCCVIPIRMTGS